MLIFRNVQNKLENHDCLTYIVIRIFSSIKLTLCKHNVVDQLNQIDYMTQQGMMLIHTTLFSVIMTCKLLMNLIILHYHILEC